MFYYRTIFSEKAVFSEETAKNRFGGTFSPIYVVLLGWLFPKTIRFTHEWTRTNHVNFMKIGSKLRLYRNFLYICIYIYKHCGFVIRNLQNEKSDHPHLPHSPPSEVEGVSIVVITFRNIAKNCLGIWYQLAVKLSVINREVQNRYHNFSYWYYR